jgi:hypothetical protein
LQPTITVASKKLHAPSSDWLENYVLKATRTCSDKAGGKSLVSTKLEFRSEEVLKELISKTFNYFKVTVPNGFRLSHHINETCF